MILPYYVNGESTRFSPLAEHALHPDTVAVRLRSKQRPRAARAEAARAGRWWPWLDSNGVTLFVQQCDRGTCCELLLAINTWYRYVIRGTCVVSAYYEKKSNACFYIEPRIRFYTRTRKFINEVTKQNGQKGPFLTYKNLA